MFPRKPQAPAKGVAQQATRWLKSLAIYVAGAATFVLALTRLQKPVEKLFPGCPKWVWLAAASAPLCVAFFTYTVPAFIAGLRERRLKAWGVSNSSPSHAGYFRLAPYETSEEDRKQFVRADGLQDVVLNWLLNSRDRVVFLTGTSGAGKSSLLNAHVLPRFAEANNIYLRVRASLTGAVDDLRQELLKSGIVWKRPPEALSDSDLKTILTRAAERVAPNQLLIVLDQFEELLLVHERDGLRTEALRSFLKVCSGDEMPTNVRVLLVLRSDYFGMAQSSDWKDLLPTMQEGRNWKEVSAFRERDARAFLEASGLKIGSTLMEHLFVQIEEIEGTAGLVRPITINMLGLAIDSAAVSSTRLIAATSRGGGLLVNFIRGCISSPEIAQHAPKVLGELINKHGQRETRDLDRLTEATGFDKPTVIGCLLHLMQRGIVRWVDQERQMWEVSHDFVARILEQVLRSWRATLAQRARLVALPTALVLWVALFVAAPLLAKRMEHLRTADVTAQLSMSNGEAGNSCPPELYYTTLDLSGLPVEGSEGLQLRAKGSPATIDYQGETGEEVCVHTIDFTQFEGRLGRLDRPSAWNSATLDARMEAAGNDQEWKEYSDAKFISDAEAEKDTHDFYQSSGQPGSGRSTGAEATLDVFVNGQRVGCLKGLVVRTGDHYHNTPYRYVIRFLTGKSIDPVAASTQGSKLGC